jgi:hypothetical protein
MQQKLAAYRYMLHRMYTLPITIWKDNRKWKPFWSLQKNNGFPPKETYKLKTKQSKS